tara:strand:+ start:698 stop:1240 length:543 start_codon:yes stop_codon:yes gene_type:complete
MARRYSTGTYSAATLTVQFNHHCGMALEEELEGSVLNGHDSDGTLKTEALEEVLRQLRHALDTEDAAAAPAVQLGTVSHGTLRTADLIDRFSETLSMYRPALAARLRRRYPSAADWADVETAELVSGPEPDIAIYYLEALEEALCDLAPAGHWFAAHEGDGSDYGFWAVDATPFPRLRTP